LALFRILKNTTGMITIGGVNIDCINLNELRKKLTIIPQVIPKT